MKGREFNQLRRAFDNTPDFAESSVTRGDNSKCTYACPNVLMFFAPQADVLCVLDWPA
jgi:hypothetical protein